MKYSHYIFIGLIFLCSCQPQEGLNDTDRVLLKEEVKAMFVDYHGAIAEQGLLAEFDFLDNSSDFFWVPPGYNSPLSFDSVKTILTLNSVKFEKVNFHWRSLQLFPLSKNIVNFSGIVGGNIQDTAGIDFPVSIIESGTCIKRSDGWKLLSGQSANLDLE